MIRRSVYLIGPIRNRTLNEVSEWRYHVKQRLKLCGIDAYSPLRGKDGLLGDGTITAKKPYLTSGKNTTKEITSVKGTNLRDYHDVRNCDLGFACFLGHDRVSIGSMLECGGFITRSKPLVVVMENDNVHQHPLLNHNAFVLENLETGIEYVKHILLP